MIVSIGNNFNIKPANSFGGLKGKKLTDEEKMQKFINYTLGKLQERGEREVPEYGHFAPLMYLIPIPGSQNEAMFTIKHNLTADKKERVFEAGVRRQNTDRMISNIIVVGEKKDVLAKIASLKEDEVIENINRLSKKIDEYYSKNN